MDKKKKALLICATSGQIISFRKALIEKLQYEGYEIHTIAFDDEYRDLIESRGIKLYTVSGANRSTNPFQLLSITKKYRNIIREVAPDIVMTFMLKPNVLGVLAARRAGVGKSNIFSMVEGAGDVFINNGIKWKFIRFVVCKMYKKAFKNANKVFFLNTDDRAEFVSRKLVKSEQCEVIPGIGVDLEHFSYKPVKNYRVFLMIARMLKTKGVIEYCRAARLVKQKYPDAVFNYLGGEGTVKISDIREYIDDGSINYIGTTDDVRPFIEDCSVTVLPSYREGLGLVNVESGAMGRAVITGNTVGTKDTVVDNYNGFLIECRSANAIVEKCIYFLENSDEVTRMGKNSRKLAEEKFDVNVVTERVVNIVTNKIPTE